MLCCFRVNDMFDNLNDLIVKEIELAIFVAPKTGDTVHNNRPFHGFVFSGKGKRNNYIFSNGFVLKVQENSLFYLPKGSSYKIDSIANGEGCWAINFDLLNDLKTEPFSVKFQEPEKVLNAFQKSVDAFQKSNNHCNVTILKNLYDIILMLKKEYEKNYIPNEKMLLIKPAIDSMNSNYFKNNLTIENLSKLCGISSTYFRRIFTERFGISPKEYIINRRMEYAKKLLLSQQFSVSEIAEMCGYSEPCHFSRDFSKRTGLSPNKYTKENIAQIES